MNWIGWWNVRLVVPGGTVNTELDGLLIGVFISIHIGQSIANLEFEWFFWFDWVFWRFFFLLLTSFIYLYSKPSEFGAYVSSLAWSVRYSRKCKDMERRMRWDLRPLHDQHELYWLELVQQMHSEQEVVNIQKETVAVMAMQPQPKLKQTKIPNTMHKINKTKQIKTIFFFHSKRNWKKKEWKKRPKNTLIEYNSKHFSPSTSFWVNVNSNLLYSFKDDDKTQWRSDICCTPIYTIWFSLQIANNKKKEENKLDSSSLSITCPTGSSSSVASSMHFYMILSTAEGNPRKNKN